MSVLLAFAGIEATAVHVNNVAYPAKTFPKAIALTCISILLIFSLGALSIAICIPSNKIVLQSGVVEAMHIMLSKYGIAKASRYISLCMSIGVVGSICAWIAGPSKSMLIAAEEGILPEILLSLIHI